MHQYKTPASNPHEHNGVPMQGPRRLSRRRHGGYISAVVAFAVRLGMASALSAVMAGIVAAAAWILGVNLQAAAPLVAVAGAMGFVAAMAELRD